MICYCPIICQYLPLFPGDVDGSVEAILDVLATYNSDQCELDVMMFGSGAVSEEDVQLAADFNGKPW